MELHEVKTTVTIDTVKLNVRFPGQLSFQLKNTHLYQDLNSLYPLANGQCQVFQTTSFTTEALYNPKTHVYKEVNVDLCISINTTSGKILAGVVPFNAVQNIQDIFALKRCSDKKAAVGLKISYELVSKLRQLQGEMDTEKPELSPVKQVTSDRKNTILGITGAKLKAKIEERASSNSSQAKIMNIQNTTRSKYVNNDSRIKQLEENHQRKIKLINKEKQQLEEQIDKLKEKLRLAQRKEKQGQIAIKQLKDANEKKKIKILEFQGKQLEHQRLLFEQEKKTKNLQLSLKESEETIALLEAKVVSLEKKVQSKDLTFAEREKKLTEKIAIIQSNNSKGLQDYNSLIEKMEAQEKSSQNTLKTKEKLYLDQKTKWKQQLEQFQAQISRLTQLNEQLTLRVSNLTQADQDHRKRLNQQDQLLESYKAKIQTCLTDIDHERSIKQQYERQLNELKSLQSDKANLKKRLNEQAQQNQKMKDKLDKLTLDHQELKQNLKHQEQLADQLRKERKQISSKNKDLQKLKVDLEKQLAKIQNQHNIISSKNTYLQERLNDLKTKLQQRQRQFADDQIKANNTINSILQSKQYLEADLQDLKWALEQAKSNIHEAQLKLREKNNQILTKEEELLKIQKEIDHFRMKEEEYSQQILTLQQEINEYKKKERENLQNFKDKDYKVYQLAKKIAELEQQAFISSSKFKSLTSQKDETISLQQATIQSLRQELAENKSKLSQTLTKLQQIEDLHRQLERNLRQQTLSLEDSDKLCSQAQSKYSNAKKENDTLKKKLEEIEERKSFGQKQYEQKIVGLSQELQDSEKQLKEKSTDLSTFKKAVQQLLLIVSSQRQFTEEIIAVPEASLAKNQLEALIIRNKNIAKNSEALMTLQVEINYLEKENQTKAKILHQKEEELEQKMKSHAQKIQELETKWIAQKKEMDSQIESLLTENDAVRTQKQKIETKLRSQAEHLQQEQKQSSLLQSELEESKTTISSIQAQLLQLRQRQISKKSEGQTLIHNIKTQLQSQVQLYKDKVSNLVKQKQTLEKIQAEKEKVIITHLNKINELQSSTSNMGQSIKNLQKELNQKDEEKLILDQKLQDEKSKTAKLEQLVASTKLSLTSETELKQQYACKLRQTRVELEQLAIEKQSLIDKFNQTRLTSTATSEELRAKILLLQQTLQSQSKKNLKLREEISKMTNENEIISFELKQKQEEIDQTHHTLQTLRTEIEAKKTQILESQKVHQELKSRMIVVEKQKHDLLLQKSEVSEELQLVKGKVQDDQIEMKELHAIIETITCQLENQKQSYQNLLNQTTVLRNSNAELKQALSSTKKDLQLYTTKAAELKSRLAIVQQQLKEKEQFYQSNKSKNWQENQRQINNLKGKFKLYEEQTKKEQQLLLRQKQQLQAQLHALELEKEQLENMLDDRDALIERQEEEILSGQSRIISLNAELRSCLQAWEKEKIASLPSRKQASKIQQDLARFQQLASDLSKKSREPLGLGGNGVKDEVIAKIGQQLVQLLDLHHRSKVKVLSSIAESEKKTVSSEYDSIKSKIEQILKSQKGQVASDSS